MYVIEHHPSSLYKTPFKFDSNTCCFSAPKDIYAAENRVQRM